LISNVSRSSFWYICLISLIFSVSIANAHEAHETRLQYLDHQLDQMSSGSSAEAIALLLHRADLQRRQRDWDAALLDYQHVAEKEPDNLVMMLGRVQLHIDQHQYLEALFWSNRILRLYPTHALAGLQQARALAGNGEVDKAAIAFERALNRFDKPRPEHYIELAQIITAARSTADSRRRAVAALDSGADVLGHPVSLHNSAYQLELKSGLREAALRRIEKIIAHNGSLLNWRLRRAELLLELERPTEAYSGVSCLIHRISQLPEQRRSSRAFQGLLQRSEGLLEDIHAMSGDVERSEKIDAIHEC